MCVLLDYAECGAGLLRFTETIIICGVTMLYKNYWVVVNYVVRIFFFECFESLFTIIKLILIN